MLPLSVFVKRLHLLNFFIFNESQVKNNSFLALLPGLHEGMLWKKGKETTQFHKRKFVLSDREFTLTYYNKEDVSSLKL